MSAATLDAPPATASPETQVDPQRERLAFERAAAIKRGENAARRLRAEADALKVKLADATRARDEALRAVAVAEAKVNDAYLMHTRARESAENQLRRSAPPAIAAARADLEELRKQICDRDPRDAKQFAAAGRQVQAIQKARNRLDELELESLSPADLAARIEAIRDAVEEAGQLAPLPRPRRVPAGLQVASDRLREIEESYDPRADRRAVVERQKVAVAAARVELARLWDERVEGDELEAALNALMAGVEAAGAVESAPEPVRRRRGVYAS